MSDRAFWMICFALGTFGGAGALRWFQGHWGGLVVLLVVSFVHAGLCDMKQFGRWRSTTSETVEPQA